jgi:hypothetical protein
MKLFYFSTINNETNSDVLEPINYIENEDDYRIIQNNNDIVLNQLSKLFPYLRNSPERKINNMKIMLEQSYCIVLSINYDYINSNNFFFVNTTMLDKKYLPLKQEKILTKDINLSIAEVLKYKDLEDLEEQNIKEINERISFIISNYYENIKTDLSDKLFKIRRNKGENYSLEETIHPNNKCNTKWDFFIIEEGGAPLTDIIRYSYSKILELDMNKQVSENRTIRDLQLLNSMSLWAGYGICSEIGKIIGKKSFLRHISPVF